MKSKTVNVILLAAGRGVRLGKLTRRIPKCLLSLSETDTVLDNMLNELIEDYRVGNICIVGGYAISALSSHLMKNWRKEVGQGKINLLYNPMFRVANNVVTFVQSVAYFHSGGIVMDGDIVCHPQIYRNALDQFYAQPERSFLVIDEVGKDRDDGMKISVNGRGTIVDIGKSLDSNSVIAEFIGITYLSTNDAKSVLSICQERIRDGKLDLYFDECLAIKSPIYKFDLYTLSTQRYPWTEIDTPDDYQRAIELYQTIRDARR